MFGIGGGVIIVPVLVLLLGFDQKTASATSLFALVLPVGILGVLEYFRAGVLTSSHVRFGLLIAFGLFIGAYFGSKLTINLPEIHIKRGFAILLIAVAIKILYDTSK